MAEEKKTVKKTTANAAAKPAGKKEAVAKAPVKSRGVGSGGKAAVKAAPKTAEPAVKESKIAAPVKESPSEKTDSVNLSVNVIDLTGSVAGKVTLPAEIFGETVNKHLLHQAIRVYQANKRQGTHSTKTRGEVDGSTRKIYRQKGTGRARHGSLRAPIFVKGGIVFGPKPRDYSLDLPKKMRRKALFSALSSKLLGGELTVIAGVESMEPKTKIFAGALKSLGFTKAKNVLLVTPTDLDNVKRATRNVTGVTTTAAARLNAYDVLRNRQVLVTKDAVAEMKKLFVEKRSNA